MTYFCQYLSHFIVRQLQYENYLFSSLLTSVPDSLILITWKDEVGSYFSSGLVRRYKEIIRLQLDNVLIWCNSTLRSLLLDQQSKQFFVVFCLWYLRLAFPFQSTGLVLKLMIGSSHKAPFAEFEWTLYWWYAACKNFYLPTPKYLNLYCILKLESNTYYLWMI